VGRPGLDPGTLGIGVDRPIASMDIRISWSVASENPPVCTEILSDLNLWLHHWLHNFGTDVTEDVKIFRSDGFVIDMRLESSSY
jgi:hypothetical protein